MEKIISIIAENLDVDVAEIKPESLIMQDLGADEARAQGTREDGARHGLSGAPPRSAMT